MDQPDAMTRGLVAAVTRAPATLRARVVAALDDVDSICVCGHAWHQHTRHASGAEPCRHYGCGCSDFGGDRGDAP